MLQRIKSSKVPGAIGSYSQATLIDSFIFTSGQLPLDTEIGDIRQQTKQSLQNIENILKDNGSDLDHVIKTTVYLKQIEDFSQMNEVYISFFKEGDYPARTAFQVGNLPKNALVEIEAIAILKEEVE